MMSHSTDHESWWHAPLRRCVMNWGATCMNHIFLASTTNSWLIRSLPFIAISMNGTHTQTNTDFHTTDPNVGSSSRYRQLAATPEKFCSWNAMKCVLPLNHSPCDWADSCLELLLVMEYLMSDFPSGPLDLVMFDSEVRHSVEFI